MSFKHKLTLFYTILALVFTLVLAGTCQFFLKSSAKQDSENQLTYFAQQASTAFNSLYQSMENVASSILMDPEVYQAIRVLRFPEKYDSRILSENEAIIQNHLRTGYTSSDFYRIIFFNNYGAIIYDTSDIFENSIYAIPDSDLIYCQEADAKHGAPVFTPLQEDYWSRSHENTIFSMIRAIQGDSLGYIVVQQKADCLQNIFTLPENLNISVFHWDNSLLYSSDKSISADVYLSDEIPIKQAYIHQETGEMLLKTIVSENIQIILSTQLTSIYSPANSATFTVMAAVFCLFALSVAFIYITSSWLTKPIREIRAQLEKTKLSNLGSGLTFTATYDEIKALGDSFDSLTARLTESIAQEKKLSLLQLQAQFDALQAQVDPHFLYNVLNMINTRGIIDDDMVICDICDDLSAMLRYSNSTLQRHATVRQELEYLRHYSRLMKTRFEDRLNISIDVSEDIMEYTLPKITIQQIVENSIHHAFEHTTKTMNIHISGHRRGNSWFLCVEDNGEGISPEALTSVYHKIRSIRQDLTQHQKNIEMEIGHMGLPNLYARLYLLYGEHFTLTIKNQQNQGTRTIIYVKGER